MIFFSPSSEASLKPQFAGVDQSVNACSALGPGGSASNPQGWSVGMHFNWGSLLGDPTYPMESLNQESCPPFAALEIGHCVDLYASRVINNIV